MRRDFCNPLNLSYQYQHFDTGRASREAADPTLVLYRGRYWLFASMSAGFYHSEDLINWQRQENRELDIYRYAPDARQYGEALLFTASDPKGVIRRTEDPLSGCFEEIGAPMDFWDPDLFADEDGRLYLYWGCSNRLPIYGVELDPETMAPVGETRELIFADPENRGWERRDLPGSGETERQPYIEGPFMNKFGGRYYLQYAAPGTQFHTYADGVFVGDGPLGPFAYQRLNPFSAKTGGFITGAGHGSTIADRYGNLWHAATMRISVNHRFERRLGLFPAGVDGDGTLFCNQSFSDYPMVIPEGKFDPMSLRPPWMLLSWRKHCEASSFLPGHEPSLAAEEDVRTWWCAEGSGGEWLRMDLGQEYAVYAVQVNFADTEVPIRADLTAKDFENEVGNRYIDSDPERTTRYLLEGSGDGEHWFVLEDKRNAHTDLAHDYLRLEGVRLRHLRITAEALPYGERFALSGLRVFGVGNDAPPAAVERFSVEYPEATAARISWEPVPGAAGYEVRWGLSPEKLYFSHPVYGVTEALLTTLNRGETYFYRVDAFGEGGVTEGLAGK